MADEQGETMAKVRFYDNEDARRELAVEMFKRHVRAAGITCDYDADIELMDRALVAFADEWVMRDLSPAGTA